MNPSLSDIKNATATYYRDRRITVKDLEGPGRARVVSHPRQIAMYIARALTTHSLPKIGKSFGERDHTTVIHAIKAVEKREYSLSDAEAIRRLLEARTCPRSALAQELAACRSIADFACSLPSLPVERDFIWLGTEG